MTSGYTTWQALEASRSVVAILNSESGRREEVEALLDRLLGVIPSDRLRVVTPTVFYECIRARGLSRASVLVASRADGDVSLTEFLESRTAISWVLQQHAQFIVESVPHSIGDEAVDPVFEDRVAVILGEARFVRHTLPGPDLLVLQPDDVFTRAGRPAVLMEYARRAQALVDGLHQAWHDRLEPQLLDPDDELTHDAMFSVLQDDGRDIGQAVARRRAFVVNTLNRLVETGGDRLAIHVLRDPPDLAVPRALVRGSRRAPKLLFKAETVRQKRNRFVIRGRVQNRHAYVLTTVGRELKRHEAAIVEGRLYAGGISVGLEKDGGWTSRVDIVEPSRFVAVVGARAPGKHHLVVAHCVPSHQTVNSAVLRSISWGR